MHCIVAAVDVAAVVNVLLLFAAVHHKNVSQEDAGRNNRIDLCSKKLLFVPPLS
jgi:hypothetical protein